MFKEDYKRTFSGIRPSAEFNPEEIYMKANQKHTPMRRVVSVALAAALLLALSVTAYATDLFGIMDFIMPNDYQSSTLPNDAAANASNRQHIAISGYINSAEAKASAEWEAYYHEYVENNIIPNENVDGLPEKAGYYGAYNREMYDKLLEIADKYDVALVENCTVGSRARHLLDGEQTSYYEYANGNFKEESSFVASDGVQVGYSLIRTVKGSISTISLEIWDAENWASWNYTTPAGDTVAVGLSGDLVAADGSPLGNRGLIMVDLGDCFVTVLVIDWDQPITETTMQELAENLDYARLATIE